MKQIFAHTLNIALFVLFIGFISLPFATFKLFKYSTAIGSGNVLSYTTHKLSENIQVVNQNGNSVTLNVKVFPKQNAYYTNVFSIKNTTKFETTFTLNPVFSSGNMNLSATFSNSSRSQRLKPGEETYIDLSVYGLKNEVLSEIVVLNLISQ